MQVMLLKDVEGLGRAGDIKQVTGGYAQNYLIARGLAVVATQGAVKQAQTLRDASERRHQRKADEAKAKAALLEGRVITLKARTGEGDRLYGSITNSDVATALESATGTPVDRHDVDLEHPIKTLGEHEVVVRAGPGAKATIKVVIEREGEPG